MIEVTSTLKIDDSEIQLDFIRASGPGGQNVNKVASSVQLRFDVRDSPSLDPDVKERLVKLAGSRMSEDGILIINAKRYRTQEKNRKDAEERLLTLLQKALIPPALRHPTHRTLTSRAKRLAEKKHHAKTKKLRTEVKHED